MWVVGSIGIVIESGGWAGFGPLSGQIGCLKQHNDDEVSYESNIYY